MYNLEKDVWLKIKESLRCFLDKDVYETYFEPINEIYKVESNEIYLLVDSVFIKNRIEKIYLSKMNSILSKHLKDYSFVVVSKDEIISSDSNENKLSFSKTNASGLNPNYTFSNFVVGDSNRFAHHIATLVADKLASVANPVYIFGDVGLGKTHLMQAIGNYISYSKPDLKILYVRTQDFFTDYVKAGNKPGGYEVFSKRYDNVDVLLVDDVQFLESKDKTQIEFFKIFEKLSNEGKLIVLTSDRKASDLTNVMTRLTSRFEWGVSLDINKPDKAHRINILCAKLKQEGVNPDDFPKETLDFIASVCDSNIRELEGALKTFLFYCNVYDCNYSIDNAKEALKNNISLNESTKDIFAPTQEIKKVLDVVSTYFRISQDALLSNSRKREIVYARQLCFYVLRNKYNLTFSKIGSIFNGKDHTTVMHGYQMFEREYNLNNEAKQNVENVLRKMGKNPNVI